MSSDSDKIEVEWEVNDGYAGGSAPQTTTVLLSEFERDMTPEEVDTELGEMVQGDFETKITFDIQDREKIVQSIMEHLAARSD